MVSGTLSWSDTSEWSHLGLYSLSGFIHYLGRQKGNVVLMLEEHWALSVGQFSFNVYFIGYIFFRAKYFGATEALAFKVKKNANN